jgi:AraC family transcriptional regulator, transcriptional activator of pobA
MLPRDLMKYCFIIICPEQTEHPVDEYELNEVNRTLKQFFKEYNKSRYGKKFELISSNSNITLVKAENFENASGHGELRGEHYRKNFQKFSSLLKNELQHSRKVSDYSARIGITTRKLSEICRFYKGKSPKAIINEYLISESKRLLIKTSHPIKNIAQQLGFSDPYQFNKYFKKYQKVPPGLYRRNKRLN